MKRAVESQVDKTDIKNEKDGGDRQDFKKDFLPGASARKFN